MSKRKAESSIEERVDKYIFDFIKFPILKKIKPDDNKNFSIMLEECNEIIYDSINKKLYSIHYIQCVGLTKCIIICDMKGNLILKYMLNYDTLLTKVNISNLDYNLVIQCVATNSDYFVFKACGNMTRRLFYLKRNKDSVEMSEVYLAPWYVKYSYFDSYNPHVLYFLNDDRNNESMDKLNLIDKKCEHVYTPSRGESLMHICEGKNNQSLYCYVNREIRIYGIKEQKFIKTIKLDLKEICNKEEPSIEAMCSFNDFIIAYAIIVDYSKNVEKVYILLIDINDNNAKCIRQEITPNLPGFIELQYMCCDNDILYVMSHKAIYRVSLRTQIVE
jgi:hypothetical protein